MAEEKAEADRRTWRQAKQLPRQQRRRRRRMSDFVTFAGRRRNLVKSRKAPPSDHTDELPGRVGRAPGGACQ